MQMVNSGRPDEGIGGRGGDKLYAISQVGGDICEYSGSGTKWSVIGGPGA